ncbi:MAG: hypothetical protein V2A65_07860 [Candidatus Omnitrophota bacterium]
MRVLAIETTGAVKSVALAEDNALLDEVSFPGDLLTEFWPGLGAFLRENRITIKDMDFFAVCNGPGSWTGLRFGLAVVKGWAVVTGKKIFVQSTPELNARVLPAHTLAAALACQCLMGQGPEEIAVNYGHLPKFKTIAK